MAEFQVDKWTSLKVEEKGEWGFTLLEGWIGREGDFKPNFCKREFGRKDAKTEKTVPVGVKLGNGEMAVTVALWLLRELTGKEYAPVGEKAVQGKLDDQDVPF